MEKPLRGKIVEEERGESVYFPLSPGEETEPPQGLTVCQEPAIHPMTSFNLNPARSMLH